jgi:hypothetical protein
VKTQTKTKAKDTAKDKDKDNNNDDNNDNNSDKRKKTKNLLERNFADLEMEIPREWRLEIRVNWRKSANPPIAPMIRLCSS